MFSLKLIDIAWNWFQPMMNNIYNMPTLKKVHEKVQFMRANIVRVTNTLEKYEIQSH